MTTTLTITEISDSNIICGLDQKNAPEFGRCLLGSILAHAENAEDTAREHGHCIDAQRAAFYKVVWALMSVNVWPDILQLAHHDLGNEIDIQGSRGNAVLVRISHLRRRTVWLALSKYGNVMSMGPCRSKVIDALK